MIIKYIQRLRFLRITEREYFMNKLFLSTALLSTMVMLPVFGDDAQAPKAFTDNEQEIIAATECLCMALRLNKPENIEQDVWTAEVVSAIEKYKELQALPASAENEKMRAQLVLELAALLVGSNEKVWPTLCEMMLIVPDELAQRIQAEQKASEAQEAPAATEAAAEEVVPAA